MTIIIIFNILKWENWRTLPEIATKICFETIGNNSTFKFKIQINSCFLWWFRRHMNESNATNAIEIIIHLKRHAKYAMVRDGKRSTKIQFGNNFISRFGNIQLFDECGQRYVVAPMPNVVVVVMVRYCFNRFSWTIGCHMENSKNSYILYYAHTHTQKVGIEIGIEIGIANDEFKREFAQTHLNIQKQIFKTIHFNESTLRIRFIQTWIYR